MKKYTVLLPYCGELCKWFCKFRNGKCVCLKSDKEVDVDALGEYEFPDFCPLEEVE